MAKGKWYLLSNTLYTLLSAPSTQIHAPVSKMMVFTNGRVTTIAVVLLHVLGSARAQWANANWRLHRAHVGLSRMLKGSGAKVSTATPPTFPIRILLGHSDVIMRSGNTPVPNWFGTISVGTSPKNYT